MKKTIFTLLVLSLFTSYSHAEGEINGVCKIESTPEYINEYVKNNRKIIQNIKKELRGETSSGRGGFLRAINLSKSWDSFYSEIDYKITYRALNEVPYQVERDARILENQKDGAVEILKSVSNNGYSQVVIESPCEGVQENCSFQDNITALELTTKLLQNSSAIYNEYVFNITGKQTQSDFEITLVSSEFLENISTDYSEESIKACSEKDGFWKTLSDSFAGIFKQNENGDDLYRDWTDSWKRLKGQPIEGQDSKEEYERKQLSKNIYGVGLNSNTDEIFSDLDSANNNIDQGDFKSLAINNNFIANSLRGTGKKIKTQLDSFEQYISNFSEESSNIDSSIIDLTDNKLKNEVSESIRLRIQNLYEKELQFSQVQNSELGGLQDNIKRVHYNLTDAIKELRESEKVAKKTNAQQGGE